MIGDKGWLSPYISADTVATASSTLQSSWPPLLNARVTKTKVMFVRTLLKPGLVGGKQRKVLQQQQQAFITDCQKWHGSVDPSDHIWAPLWGLIKASLDSK